MILREPARMSAVPPVSLDFKSYMARHYMRWHEFVTQVLRLDYKPEDIILVRGTVKTTSKSWAVAAYLDDGNSMHEVSVHVKAGPVAGMGFDLASEHIGGRKFDYRIGAQMASRLDVEEADLILPLDSSPVAPRTRPQPITRAEEFPEAQYEEGPNSSAADHCVFLQYFKLKPRWPLSGKIVAHAGPAHLPPPQSPMLGSAVLSRTNPYDVVSFPFHDNVSTLAA